VRPIRLVPILLTGSLVVAGIGVGGGLAAPKKATVKAKITGFTPRVTTVAPGAKITWRNLDVGSLPHNAVSTKMIRGKPAFTSGQVTTAATFSAKAPSKKGRYPYICSIHPTTMKATLVVK
jgi:plastocyanin